MHLRRHSGRSRRLLRVTAREPVVALARAPERLSVPVGTARPRVGGRLPPVAVAARLARRPREGPVLRDLRCGRGGRSRLRGSRGRALRDPNPFATVYPVRVGRCLLPPRHEVLGRRSGALRGRGDLSDWLRGAVANGCREIRDHPPGSSADRGQQRPRLALDPGAVEQEHRERYPHRRNENGGDGRRQMSERLHGRIVGSDGRSLMANAASSKIARNQRFFTISAEFSALETRSSTSGMEWS
jgi:hypothetical protein